MATHPPPPGSNHRPTDDEFDARVDFCFDLLVSRVKRGEIKRQFRERFQTPGQAKIPARTIGDYVARARSIINAVDVTHREEEKKIGICYWRSVIADPDQPQSEKRHAQIEIQKIFGLYSPAKISPTTPEGEPLSFSAAMAEMEALVAATSDR